MDKHRVQELIDKYLNGNLRPEEKVELEELFRKYPEARQCFHRSAEMESLLLQWGERFSEGNHPEVVVFDEKTKTSSGWVPFRGWKWVVGVGIAATVVLAFGAGVYNWIEGLESERAFAQISYESQAQWDSTMAEPVRGRFQADTYSLASGFVRLKTKSGATVSIAAPTQFELREPDEIHLSYGKMTARLSTDEASLRVFTDSMDIRDLGTAFGLQVQENGESSVSVFEGLVEVKKSANDLQQVTLGEGLTLKGNSAIDLQQEQKSRYAENYNDLWPLTLGIDSYSPLVRLNPPGPINTPLVDIQSSTYVHLFPEQQGVVLSGDVMTDLSEAGYSWPAYAVRNRLPKGVSLSSFLLCFNPEKEGGEEWLKRVSGQVAFQKDIVGIICMNRTLVDSDDAFAIPGLEYGHQYGDGGRGLESEDVVDFGYYVLAHDVVSLSKDRKQLYFNLNATTLVDQIRVIVAD